MAFLKLTLTEPLKIEIKETAKQQNQTVGEYVEELHRTHITPTTYKQKFLYAQCDVYTAINYYQNTYPDCDLSYLYKILEDLNYES